MKPEQPSRASGRLEQEAQESPELGVSFSPEDLVDSLLDALDSCDARGDALVAPRGENDQLGAAVGRIRSSLDVPQSSSSTSSPIAWGVMFAPRASSVRRLPSGLIWANTAECDGFCGNPAPTTPSNFRRGFPLMAELVRQTPSGATARSEPIAAHLDFLLNGIHNHHSGEDANIWPRLLERAAPKAELIIRMEKQHEVVAECSTRVRTLSKTWRRTAADGEALAAALDEFTRALVEHLDEEEAHVVPLVRHHISAEEWTMFGQETFEKFTNPEKLIATGTLEEVATPRRPRGSLATSRSRSS